MVTEDHDIRPRTATTRNDAATDRAHVRDTAGHVEAGIAVRHADASAAAWLARHHERREVIPLPGGRQHLDFHVPRIGPLKRRPHQLGSKMAHAAFLDGNGLGALLQNTGKERAQASRKCDLRRRIRRWWRNSPDSEADTPAEPNPNPSGPVRMAAGASPRAGADAGRKINGSTGPGHRARARAMFPAPDRILAG